MLRVKIAIVALMVSVFVLGWSTKWDTRPKVPTAGLYGNGIGRCVTLYEGDVLVGYTINRTEDMKAADKNRDAYAVATFNALGVIAQQAGRPDLASKAVDLKMVDQFSASATVPECVCENTIWSGDPRKGGRVLGCGGSCGSCTHCRIVGMQ